MPTKIIIDGYNFMWQDQLFRNEAIRGHDKGRSMVLKWVASTPRLQEFEVTIVFDAYKTDALHASEEKVDGVTVVYTAGGETADDLIRQLASRYAGAAIIVSSDREVARYAEKKGCGVLGSREFQRVIEAPADFDTDPSRKFPQAKRRALARLLNQHPLKNETPR